MPFLTLQDYIQMGEMGKRRRGFFRKVGRVLAPKPLRKLHSKLVKTLVPKPLRKLDPMYRAPKKRGGGAPVSQDLTTLPDSPTQTTVDATGTVPGPTVTDPSLVASGYGANMPSAIPLAPSAPVSAPPPTGGAAPSPFPMAPPSPVDDSSQYDEDVNFDDETSSDGDTDYGSNSPKSADDSETEYSDEQNAFVEDQTNTQLNEPDGKKNKGQHDDTIDGWYDPEDQVTSQLGQTIVRRAGRNIFQVRMPKYRQADIFDRATNPHLYRKGRYQGGLVRQGRQSINPRALARRKVKMGNASGVSDWLPQDTTADLKWAAAGWALWAASVLMPAKYRHISKAAGIGAIGIAGVQLFQQMFGSQKKTLTAVSTNFPQGQKASDVRVTGSFVNPARGGTAYKNFLSPSYPLQFSVTNRGSDPVTVAAIVSTEEFPRVTGSKTASQRQYDIKDLAPGEQRTISDSAFPFAGESLTNAPFDVNGTITVVRATGDKGTQVGNASWTVYG